MGGDIIFDPIHLIASSFFDATVFPGFLAFDL